MWGLVKRRAFQVQSKDDVEKRLRTIHNDTKHFQVRTLSGAFLLPAAASMNIPVDHQIKGNTPFMPLISDGSHPRRIQN